MATDGDNGPCAVCPATTPVWRAAAGVIAVWRTVVVASAEQHVAVAAMRSPLQRLRGDQPLAAEARAGGAILRGGVRLGTA